MSTGNHMVGVDLFSGTGGMPLGAKQAGDPRLLGPTADDHRLAELSFPEALRGDGALEKGYRGGPSPSRGRGRRRRMINRYSSRRSPLKDFGE